jgi:hypothetical protein
MNETDMELQAIRQKLQSLKAEAPVSEAISNPWAPPRPAAHTTAGLDVAAAIETLKQRSSRAYGDDALPGATLLTQELHQFEGQLQRFNALASQQESIILGLRQLAAQMTPKLGQPGFDHEAELTAIAAFFEVHDSITVPVIESDRHGQLTVHYRLLDFYRAERDADSVAHSLRRRPRASQPAQALNPASAAADQPWEPRHWGADLQAAGHRLGPWLVSQARRSLGATARNSRARPRYRFTVIDAAIWFSAAAILRVLLDVVFQFYPVLWTPLIGILIGIVAIALYRAVLTPAANPGFSYRILIALAGLFVGGQFL